jgi:hypothetical protein
MGFMTEDDYYKKPGAKCVRCGHNEDGHFDDVCVSVSVQMMLDGIHRCDCTGFLSRKGRTIAKGAMSRLVVKLRAIESRVMPFK